MIIDGAWQGIAFCMIMLDLLKILRRANPSTDESFRARWSDASIISKTGTYWSCLLRNCNNIDGTCYPKFLLWKWLRLPSTKIVKTDVLRYNGYCWSIASWLKHYRVKKKAVCLWYIEMIFKIARFRDRKLNYFHTWRWRLIIIVK